MDIVLGLYDTVLSRTTSDIVYIIVLSGTTSDIVLGVNNAVLSGTTSHMELGVNNAFLEPRVQKNL